MSPEANYSGEFHELTLPISGEAVRVNRARFKVRDNEKAVAICGDKVTNIRLSAAKLAMRIGYADGRPILMEDILDWWEDDMQAVNTLFGDTGFFLTPTKSLSLSPTSPAGV